MSRAWRVLADHLAYWSTEYAVAGVILVSATVFAVIEVFS